MIRGIASFEMAQAGSGEVVVNEPLSGESAKQTPDNAVLQMEVDDVLVHGPGVVEDDRPDQVTCRTSPTASGRDCRAPERVHCLGPGRVGSLALIEGGKLETVNRLAPVLPSPNGFKGSACIICRAHRDCGAEMVLSECQPVLRGFEPVLEPLNLGLQVLLPLAGRFQFLLDDLSVLGVWVGSFQLFCAARRCRGDGYPA